jgi:stearoyl-CoA desaturase (delta-9 desaturase)
VSSLAVNQRFYGFVAGEWHNNHHAFRASANSGFGRMQPDIPFAFIKLLHRLGVVSRYTNHQSQFIAKYVAQNARETSVSRKVETSTQVAE